ncbi:hypothetical protein BGX27_004053 [Mortierella sp. AM989]|nr:hypothetical protein BGX27_004053 [Mortierella sp. AM989]
MANKPSSHVHSEFRVGNGTTDKPLPPIPIDYDILGRTYFGEEFSGHDGYHEAESSRAFTSYGKEEIPNVSVNQSILNDQGVRSDHHCPLTDDSKKIQLIGLQAEVLHPLSTIPSKAELEQEGTLISVHSVPPSLEKAPPSSRLETFRFPMRASPIEKTTLERPHRSHHSQHQSLPYNRSHSRMLSRAIEVHALLPSEIARHARNSFASALPSTHHESLFGLEISGSKALDQRSHMGALEAQSADSDVNTTEKRIVGPERLRRHGFQRHKRSESCRGYSHRRSLSLNSAKKALLSLQDRRVSKPHAKVHRLPDIKTTATPTAIEVPVRDVEPPKRHCASEMMNVAIESNTENQDTATKHDEREDDVEVLETSQDTTENMSNIPNNSQDNINKNAVGVACKVDENQVHVQCLGQGSAMELDTHDELPTDLCASTTVLQDQSTPTQSQRVTKSEFGSTLSSALEALTIDPGSDAEAKEVKRFVKRSHALSELETTEESYVNDLDILLNVYLRVLESKPWFPQIIHAKMCRCVNGLLTLHRNFHSRIEASTAGNYGQERYSSLKVYKGLADSVKILSHDNYLYSTFCELRMRTVNEINRSAGQATMALLQRESRELMSQQGRPSTRSDLKDFLIKPIQRVCRYPLLLKEILRLTNENDLEYQYIEQSYQLMKGKAREMDETQRMVERRLLTEQFLKKLPDTNFPRRTSLISNKDQLISSSNGDPNLSNNANINHTSSSSVHQNGNNNALTLNSGYTSDNCFGFGPSLEEFSPTAFTKAFAGTLGSIVLAGALEYVITPDMPIRLKYYGCFLFETMLIVVKAKKSNQYEPRQWLPLRLCELHETTKLDGYTRFGWRLMFDQFRMDFGANSAAEQHVWISTLQDRIRAAKEAYIRLPRDITNFEMVVSSLPWRANSSFAAGYPNLRHQHTSQQSPLPSPSPWSSCSSAIPSPLMPPPPSASSSTMMMAMSSMVTIEPEKWNSRGCTQALDNYAYRHDHCPPEHPLGSKNPDKTRHPSTGDHGGVRIGGMASNWDPDRDFSEQNQGTLSSFNCPPRNVHDPQLRPDSQTLNPSAPMSWLLYENRPRNNSFDVTRVFASSSSVIKPNQRILVQSMFKDVSTEHIWTSTTAALSLPQPASALSRSLNPLNHSQQIAIPSTPQTGSGVFNAPAGWDPTGFTTLPVEDNHAYSYGIDSPSSSLTSRILRRRDSVLGARSIPNGLGSTVEKNGMSSGKDTERRRNSATAAITGTISLNFRKNSDPQHHRQHRRSSSIVETGRCDSYMQERGGCETPVNSRTQVLGNLAASSQEPFASAVTSYSSLLSIKLDDNGCDSHSQLGSENSSLAAGKELMDTLNNVGEAARSRRGNSDRIAKNSFGKSLRTSSSSHSLPARLRPTSSSVLSLLASSSVDVPKDNMEKIWSAMGRIIPKRVSGGGYEKNGRSRANSNSSNNSNHASPMNHTGDSASASFSLPGPWLQLQSNTSDSQEQCTFHEGVLLHNGRPPSIGGTILRRTSTRDSRSTIASRASSLGYSEHTRTESVSTNHSVESDMSPDGTEVTMASSIPPRPTLSTSAPAPNCTTKARSQDLRPFFTQDKSQSANKTEYRPPLPLPLTSDRNAKSTNKSRLADHHRHQYHGQDRPDPLSSTSSQDRRKSLSILQNITHSASQKFRTLIRSQNGPRRRSVMGLTPTSIERSSSLGDITAEREDCEAGTKV